MTGDVGEDFNALKEQGKARRASHRETSPAMLEEAGIPFSERNNGAHLIVEGKDCFIDFWPGTGRWKARTGTAGFGVRNLIKHILG